MRDELQFAADRASDDPSIAAEVAFASLFDAETADPAIQDAPWRSGASEVLHSDSEFVVDSLGRIRVRGKVVARVPIGMEPKADASAPYSRKKARHGFPRFQQGCRCRTCCTGYCDSVGAVALRVEGWTLDAIGEVMSLTRERARQVSMKAAPWRPWDAVQTDRRMERELIEQSRRLVQRELAWQPCPTCGDEFEAGGQKRYCSQECRERYDKLRYHLDEGRRLQQRLHMATWVVRNSERASATHYRQALKILEHGPDHGSGKRWLVEGTETWRVAVDACRRGLPVFDELPTDVRRQVQQHLDMPVDEPNDDESDAGITAEQALNALDEFFTDAELS